MGIATESPAAVVTVIDWLKGPVGAVLSTATVNDHWADPPAETMAGPTAQVSHVTLVFAVRRLFVLQFTTTSR